MPTKPNWDLMRGDIVGFSSRKEHGKFLLKISEINVVVVAGLPGRHALNNGQKEPNYNKSEVDSIHHPHNPCRPYPIIPSLARAASLRR